MKLAAFLVLVVFLGVSKSSPPDDLNFRLSHEGRSQISKSIGDETYRLPPVAEPIHYDIELTPDLEKATFAGLVTIEITIIDATKIITLHQLNLDIKEEDVTITVVADWDNGVEVTKPLKPKLTFDKERHFVILSVDELLGTNSKASITIQYTGTLNDNKAGFYKAVYQREGKDVIIASTQFESTNARQAFPCFDEPHLKATFQVTINFPDGYNAVSNTPKISKDSNDKKYVFYETVKMSTYLLAFAVTDFKMITTYDEVKEFIRIPHQVYARPEYINDGRAKYPLGISVPTMRAVQEFVGGIQNYENKQMVQIGIPDDYFAAGAMENWGLVTYRETLLLHKDGLSTSAEKQRIASIVAHEYAHMWFGNLVTPEWWNFIWLNEGFGTYFEHYAADKVEPTMRIMEQFVPTVTQYAMAYDASENSRAITKEAWSPSEISDLFDVIAYDKAGAVLRMVEHIVSTEHFKTALNNYLTNRKLDVANEDHLWDTLEKASKIKDFKNDMKKWTSQAGVPLVTATRNKDDTITLKQEHFVLTGDPTDQTWPIPISIATKVAEFDDTAVKHFLKKSEETLPIKANDWFILNVQAVGYYRVLYDDATMAKLIALLKSENFGKIPPANRAQLVDDSFNLAKAGKLEYSKLFDLLEYMKQETDYIPLYSFMQGLNHLETFAVGLKNKNAFSKLIQDILQATFEKLGDVERESDSHTDRLSRILVLQALCKHGHEDCLSKMEIALVSRKRITPDSQSPVYCGAMRKNSAGLLDQLLELYKSDVTEYTEKNRIIAALGCANDETKLNSLLTTKEMGIEDKHKMSLLTSMYSSSELGLNVALDHVISTYRENSPRDYTNAQLATALKGISKRVATKTSRDKLRNFVETLKDVTLKDDITKYLSANDKWLETYSGILDEYFSDSTTDSTTESTTKSTTKSTPDSTTTSKPGGATMIQFSTILFSGVITLCLFL